MRLPKLGSILSAEGVLQPLIAKTRELRALAGLVDGFLPRDLACRVTVGNLKEGKLSLIAANSPIAAKVKLLGPSLSRFLAKTGWQVNSVSVRVQPTKSPQEGPDKHDAASHKSARFTAQNLADLRALHDRLGESPAKTSLQRLLERHGVLPPTTPRPAARPQTARGAAPPRKRRA